MLSRYFAGGIQFNNIFKYEANVEHSVVSLCLNYGLLGYIESTKEWNCVTLNGTPNRTMTVFLL
jgi:hypothetical protein